MQGLGVYRELKIRQSSVLYAGSMGQTTHRPSVLFFHKFMQISLQKLFQFLFLFYNFTKIKIKSFECPEFKRNHEKKKCLEHQTHGR